MTRATTDTSTDSAATAKGFLTALSSYDFDRLESYLAANVWFRALLPKSIHESKTSRQAADAYRRWYAGAHRFKALDLEHRTMEGREYLRYRFQVLPEWAPDQWHIVEQAGFCRVRDGRISRLDVVCTGFHPIHPEAAKRATRRRVA
jgi:hypothetical protein